MATKIRLTRGGAKKRPYYRVVVADVRAPRDGNFIEKIGSYDPMLPKDSENRVQIDADRAKYWLGQGAQPTERVEKMLFKLGITDKITDFASKPKRRGKKAPAEVAEAPAAEAPAEEAANPEEAA